MNAPDPMGATLPASWAERNQRWLVAQLTRLRERLDVLGDAVTSAAATRRPEPALASTEPNTGDGFVPALLRLAALFGLSPFERDTLLLAAGFDLDRALRQSLARHAAPGRASARPSFSLALALLPGAHWDALSPRHRCATGAC